MDCDYPDPDEEFDLAHEDEYEILRELEAAELQNTLSNKTTQQQQQIQKEYCQVQVNNINNNKQTSHVCSSQSQNNKSQAEDVFLMNKEVTVSQSNETSNKRSIDQITDVAPTSDYFDPVNLIDLDEFNSPKKKRPCWDQPEEVIKAILERRKNNHKNNAQINREITSVTVEICRSKSITKRVPGYNFIAVTRIDDGDRFYIKVSDKNKYELQNYRSTSNSLIKSFDKLKNEAELILQEKAEKASLLDLDIVEVPRKTTSKLWVDKYRPQRYLDLLSDETVNRSLLYWLQLWDKIVFDRDPTVRKRKPQTQFKSKNNFRKKEEDIPDHDSKGFPTQRIALLSGPPGLGKTTLAHIAAKHAGYNIVELNASDDRGPEAFREALLASTQMTVVLDKEKRPNCLVLDEIDGAPAASIELLLKFIHGKLLPKGKNVRTKTRESNGCRRPIICICNDLYAPSLRPLRLIALIISVPEISPSALAERLASIMRAEGLKVDMKIMIQLAEKSACDIRACLGILQYTGGNTKMIQNLAFGLKDMRKGLFDSWKEMLQVPTSRLGYLSINERVKKIAKLAYQVETDRLVQGVFHNYPTNCKDKIVPVFKSLEWFEFYDVVTTLVMEHQTWMLMPYINSAIIAWHLYLSNIQIPKITYPSTMFEVNQKLERNKAILMTTKKTCKIDIFTLLSDILPYLPDFLCPRLRPVNFQLYSLKEKQELEHLIDVMLNFGLTFTQIKKAGGGYEYILDPNLWDLGTFPECKSRKPMPYSVKQIVIQALETARIHRAAIQSGETTVKSSNKVSPSKNTVDILVNSKSRENVPNHLRQTLNPVELQPAAEKKSLNFFAAFQLAGQEKYKKKLQQDESMGIVNTKEIKDKEKKETEKKRKKLLGSSNVWYEYKEGYSNAVRRTVLMKDLL